MTGKSIRVLVVDDQALMRESLATLLDTFTDITVVGQAQDGNQAIMCVRELLPDIVLMDLRMPRRDGISATRIICSDLQLAPVRVCALTMFELDDYLFAALEAGASGFLLKDAEPTELAASIRRINAGEQAFSPTVLCRLIDRALKGRPPSATLPSSITPREQEVLALIAQGLTNPEIQRELFISAGTLKSHISHLLTKLNARDRPQLIITAFRAGIVAF